MESFDHFLVFAPEVLLKLFIAVLCGGVFGLERERLGKPAGLRTNVLICVGSTLYTLMSLYISGDMHMGRLGLMPSTVGVDVSRIASQIVVGIGFLGAGTILRERGSVVGLTTAAMVWTVGAIGIFIGAGYVYVALCITLFAALTLMMLKQLELRALGKCLFAPLLVRFRDDDITRREVVEILAEHEIEVHQYGLKRENGELILSMTYCSRHPSHHRFLPAFQALPGFLNSETGVI